MIHALVSTFPRPSYHVYVCDFMWFPLLEAGCSGLERCCVFVLVVWYALFRMWCVFLGSLRVTGQVLIACGGLRLPRVCVRVRVCEYMCTYACHCGSPELSHNLISCGFQRGSFPVIKVLLAPTAAHGEGDSWPERCGDFARFSVMWQQVWTGMQPAVNHYHQCLSLSAL